MFAKVFSQILQSSLADDYLNRLVFEDFLKLCDINGVVDMTPESIARITNVPYEIVAKAIAALEAPDKRSRSPENEGRRIIRLDEHRDWGWLIVNYEHYRKIASEEQRREKTLARVRAHREKSTPVTPCNAPKRTVTDGNARNAMQRQREMDKKKKNSEKASPSVSDEGKGFSDWFKTILPPEAKLTKNWRDNFAVAYDEMIRLDSRTKEQIVAVCKWARKDPFWSANFLSPLKLRKTNGEDVQYFDVFSAAMNRPAAPTTKPPLAPFPKASDMFPS